MKVTPKEIQQVASALAVLRPCVHELVLVGGRAHRLFHLHPLARPRDFEPLWTNDVDLAVAADLTYLFQKILVNPRRVAGQGRK